MPTVGILHSGRTGKHDAEISALTNKIDKKAGTTILPPVYGNDDLETLRKHADDLINKHKVDVFVAAGGTRCAEDAKKQTSGKNIPVVFTSVDNSFVPGSNMTGIYAHTSKLDPTRLRLLHELLPAEKDIGALTASRPNPSDLKGAASVLGLNLELRGRYWG